MYIFSLLLPGRAVRGNPREEGFPAIKVCGSLSLPTLLGGLFIRYFVKGTARHAAGAEGTSVEAGLNKSIMTCIHQGRCVFSGSPAGGPAREAGRPAWGDPRGGPGAAGPGAARGKRDGEPGP